MQSSFLFILLLTAGLKAAWASATNVEVQKFDDVTHIEFSGSESWNVTRQKDGQKIVVEVPPLESNDLLELKTLSNKFVKKVEIEASADNKNKIVFNLSGEQVQAFDYITDDPNRLIIDFFEVKKEKKVAEKKSNKKQRKPASDYQQIAKNQNISNEDANIKTPTLGVYDGSDPEYSRFSIKDYEVKESAKIASKRNIYIKFPMLSSNPNYLEKLSAQSPVYEFKVEDTTENKKARLLLTLFNNKRFVVFLKTLSLFKEEFPSSKYNDVLGFMEADAYYGLWTKENKLTDFEVAMTKYKHMSLNYPDSELTERTLLLIGYSLESRGDYLGAYTEFQRFVRERPTSPYYQQVKMSMADALTMLAKYDDAMKLLSEIESDVSMGKFAIEAAYKKGDIYFTTNQYEKAVESYQAALKKYPEYQMEYPNAFYNMAESQFWLGKHERSLESFRGFIKRFPSSSHGGYAMTRMGEILEILGASNEKITGAFLESIFRYKGSQGAGVANIRLLGYRIPSKNQKEIDDQIKEIDGFIKTSNLTRLQDFKTVMLSDGYFNKKEFGKSLDLLIGFYKQNPTSNNLDIFSNRIVQNITEQIYNEYQKNNYIGAIQKYGQYTNSWLKNSDRLDLQYLIAQSFEKTSVYPEAELRYLSVLNKLSSIRGKQEEKERGVFERLPSLDEVHLRLANVYFNQTEFSKAKDYLVKVNESGLKTANDKIDKVYLSSQIYEKIGQTETAIGYLQELTDAWESQPGDVSKVYLRLAKLYKEQDRIEESLEALNKITKISQNSEAVNPNTMYECLELKGDIQMSQKNTQGAIETYKKMLNLFEEKIPSASIRYKLGKVYYESGNYAEAEKTWAPLNTKPEAQFWSRLATEQLSQSKWESEYKKYVNRIPAMADEEMPNRGDQNESSQK